MKFFLRYKITLLVLYATSAGALSQVDRPEIIAAYINNFTRYTTWPREYGIDSFYIVIYTDNEHIIREFNAFVYKRRIKEKPVSLVINKSMILPGTPHLILITSEKSDYLPEIYDAIEGRPVLLISEEYLDKRNVMINLYKTQQNQILFEVNRANILFQNLIIDPEMLLAGGTQIDVASLYRDSQLDLRTMQKNMQKMNDSLEFLHKGIQTSIVQINHQQSEIIRQKQLITERTEDLDSHQKVILSQKMLMASQKDSIFKKDQVLEIQKIESVTLEYILKERQKLIDSMNVEITDKDLILDDQSNTIERQKQIMLLSLIIGLLIVILVVSIFIGYRKNKTKRDILLSQKKEIEINLEELKQLNIKLQEADQYKSIFLASMSHELRTPLNSIIGYTGILLMGMTGTMNDEQNKQLNKVKNNAKHLLNLINDILDISKIEADRVEIHSEEFNIKSLITEVCDTIHPKILEKQLELTVQIPDDLIVNTDMRRIKQVVLNLVSNAVNYTDSGSIHIQAARLPERYGNWYF
jgi:hypothetical protein